MKLWCNGSFHLFGDNYRIYHQVLTDKGKIIAFDEDVYKFHIDEKNRFKQSICISWFC